MSRFNLSEWSLAHRGLVLYLMVMLTAVGVFAYQRLGQSEDPPFTFKVMVVRTLWPGATAREVELQLTDRIEKKLQEAPNLERLLSYSRPGESVVLFEMKGSAPASAVPETWYQVRKRVGDIRATLPTGIQGPFFNDEFGDVLGNIYALQGEGFLYADLKTQADRIRQRLLQVPNVAKVELLGVQEEKLWIEISNARIAALGLDPPTVFAAIQQQNAVTPAGAFETDTDKIQLRVSGGFDSTEQVRNLVLRAGARSLRLGDIARVWRGYADPPSPSMRYMGHPALGLGIAMAAHGNIIDLGRDLDLALRAIRADLPIGLELNTVCDQPVTVQKSIREFLHSLSAAVLIVLAVSLVSLGVRAGLVVVLVIPAVLAITFLSMYLLDIGLHKISLGALILSLGLLVDDAIIAVEMMAVKMEQGWDRLRAASFTYRSTAFPMLTGTLVTAAGFLPIATAQSTTGEYTRSIFQVTVIALVVSWFAAVVFIPWLGYQLLPDSHAHGRAAGDPELAGEGVYQTRFYRRFRALVTACVTHRIKVVVGTALLLGLSVVAFRWVPQQFFPASNRPELIIDLRLAQGGSIAATAAAVGRLEAMLATEPEVLSYVSYVGVGSPRFYLPLDQQLPADNFGQVVVLTGGSVERERVRTRLIATLRREFPALWTNISRLENGPPVGFPVQFRVGGEDIPTVRRYAAEVAAVMRSNPHLSDVQFDWDEPSKVTRVVLDQERARLVGLSSQDVAQFLRNSLNGTSVTFQRDGDRLVEVLVRGPAEERAKLSLLSEWTIPTPTHQRVPLAQLAHIEHDFETGLVWRRNHLPTVTVRANIHGTTQAPEVTAQVDPLLDPLRARLPPGYTIEIGGAVEESVRGQRSVAAGAPLFVVTVLTVLMIQLQSFQRVLLVVATAPLGFIGVTVFLLLFKQPFGFVAMLGTIALSGMIMRNSLILIDQIEQDIALGQTPFQAVIEATVRRCRPIVLTAAAAVLAMIPLISSAFFGPMAVAIMGGLVFATLLTLVSLPALYAVWFRIDTHPAGGREEI